MNDHNYAENQINLICISACFLLPIFSFSQPIACGQYHSLAVCSSGGTVWAWGMNNEGQIGNNTSVSQYTPVQVLAGAAGGTYLTGIVAVAGGDEHSLAVRTDGTVWAWGLCNSYQLGQGLSSTSKWTPVQVQVTSAPTFLTGVIAVAAGEYHSIALKNDGTVWAWGDNFYGQLGINNTTNQGRAKQVLAGAAGGTYLTGIIAISSGRRYSLALRNDGTVWAWGINNLGQLGDNTISDKWTPVQVLAGAAGGTYLTGITAIAGGDSHTRALRNDGTVWAWGMNNAGQLGDNTTSDRLTPVQVLAGAAGGTYLTGITALAAGSYTKWRTLALRNDGTVWNWGWNNWDGYLGTNSNTIEYSATPIQVLAGASGGTYLTGITAVAAGREYSIALKNNGTVWAWGKGGSGELGDGAGVARWTPVQTIGLCSVGYLPVELLYFTPSCSPKWGEVVLKWATASEENNDYFTIERSADGRIFEEVGRSEGAGNSSTVRSYEFTDVSHLSFGEGIGERFYRLKQIDYDGEHEYSPIASIHFPCGEKAISIVPNPSSGVFSVIGLSLNTELSIFNVLGEKVYTSSFTPLSSGKGDGGEVIDLSSQPDGIYFLHVKSDPSIGSGGTAVQKLIIHK